MEARSDNDDYDTESVKLYNENHNDYNTTAHNTPSRLIRKQVSCLTSDQSSLTLSPYHNETTN